MANIADVIFKVCINDDESSFGKIEEIQSELEELSYEYYELIYQDETLLEIAMGGRWVAPIEQFQDICNRYGCSILGVAYDFSMDYVDSFVMYSDLPVEDDSNHFITVETSGDTQVQIPVEGDENFLDELK